ncbi:MAG: HDOD domain-containing protein [Syntrophobacteraceae bacterium]
MAKDLEFMSTYTRLDEQEIGHQISRIKELPPSSRSLQRLITLVSEENEATRELESIICYDQALATKILRIANSTFYGCRGTVTNISKALVFLGFRQAKSICLCTLLMNMLSGGTRVDPGQRERLWKHAFATSKIAAQISQKRPWISLEDAAVMGLIHDIGYLIMAAYFPEQFTYIMNLAAKTKSSPWCVELQVGLTHARLGKYAAVQWAFPESLQAVIEFHHLPEMSPSFQAETRTIYLADILSNSREYPELLEDETTLDHCRYLHIQDEEWQDHQENLDSTWSEVDQLWDLFI